MLPEIYPLLEKVRSEKPLIHHITNWVTIYDCANIVRALGAFPVMAHASEEVGEMAGISSALVLNIGTLTTGLVSSMLIAGKAANRKGIPVILDAVGAGATAFRTEKTNEILSSIDISILKGNAGEIATLAGVEAEVRGVESVSVASGLLPAAKKLSKTMGLVIAITGKEDFVVDARAEKARIFTASNGNEMMGRIVGTGCMAASAIGAFAAVEKDYALAAASALSCFGIAGELAANESMGMGTYKERFYDGIYSLDREKVEKMKKLELVCE